MDMFAWILGIILAAGFGVAGVTKLFDLDRMREHLRYSKRQYQLIGLAELCGSAGIVVGLASTRLEWIGLAAGVGICSLMLGALMAHARVNDDGKKIVPALVMMTAAIVFMIALALR